MKCCNENCNYVERWDDPSKKNHWFNVYVCAKCGSIFKEIYTKGPVIIKVDMENKIENLNIEEKEDG